ncbi:MAG: sulfurtransferase TusA family protein [Synergistaceae bacterium]|nr:sulfurtransferase TusA family protein [Synergistaceae bacterium]
MEKKTVDARGLSCPQPVIETKRVLDKMSAGEIEILVDTVTSRENVIRFAQHAGWKSSWAEKDGGYAVTAKK